MTKQTFFSPTVNDEISPYRRGALSIRCTDTPPTCVLDRQCIRQTLVASIAFVVATRSVQHHGAERRSGLQARPRLRASRARAARLSLASPWRNDWKEESSQRRRALFHGCYEPAQTCRCRHGLGGEQPQLILGDQCSLEGKPKKSTRNGGDRQSHWHRK